MIKDKTNMIKQKSSRGGAFFLFGCVGQESKMTGALDSGGQFSLMLRANACYTAGKDFSSFGYVTAELGGILIVDVLGFVYAESTDLLAAFSHAAAALFSIVCHNYPPKYQNGRPSSAGNVVSKSSVPAVW